MENYSIHKLEKENFEQLVPLMKDCFGMNVDVNYFKWKYFDNPSGFVEGYYAKCLFSGEIAAYYGGIPQTFFYKKKTYKVIQSCDTMTHSKHRRKGLFEMLTKHCDSELEKRNELFVIGFGGSKTAPGYIKYGWKLLFEVRNYFILPIQIKLFYTQYSNQFDVNFDLGLEAIQHLLSKNDDHVNDVILIDRSFNNYKWRLKNPLHKYKIAGLYTKSTSQLTSYIVYYIENDKIVIFDFYFENKKQGKFLLSKLYSYISSKFKIKGFICFCQENSIWSKTLSQLGFLSNPFSKGPLSEKMYFVINASLPEDSRLFVSDCWNVNSFDHDCL